MTADTASSARERFGNVDPASDAAIETASMLSDEERGLHAVGRGKGQREEPLGVVGGTAPWNFPLPIAA